MIRRQIYALTLLIMRHGARAGSDLGATPKGRLSMAFVGRLCFLGYLAAYAHIFSSRQILALESTRDPGVGLALAGCALLQMVPALFLLMPEMGKARPPLRHVFLETLPVSPLAKVVVTWVQGTFFTIVSGAYIFGVAPEQRSSFWGFAFVLVFVLTLGLGACSAGMALVTLARMSLAAHVRRRLASLPLVALTFAMGAIFGAPFMLRVWRPFVPAWLCWFAEALRGMHELATLGVLAAAATGFVLITVFCEKRGYDHIDTPAPERHAGSVRKLFRVADVERVLFRREQGNGGRLLFCLFAGVNLLGLVTLRYSHSTALGMTIAASSAAALVAILRAMQLASATVKHDVDARPFLCTLPVAPSQTLDGKIAIVRRHVFPLALLALPGGCLAAYRFGTWAITWRLSTYLASVWLLSWAAVPVAFLSSGVGSNASSTGASGTRNIATTLLLFPILSVCTARTLIDAVVALVMLAAVGREAHRSAVRCVQWVEDPGVAGHATPVWPALLAWATFYSVQGLVSLLALLVQIDGTCVAVASYTLAAAVLLVLTYLQAGTYSVRLKPRRWSLMALGALAGAASAAVSVGIVRLMVCFGWTPPATASAAAPGIGPSMLLVMAVLLAPLVEEPFFRGWLQSAIGAELAPRRRHLAVLYGASAFAMVHVGSAYVPQFVLGLVTGSLYAVSGGLLPAMIAHCVHNYVVMLVGG